MTFQSFDPDGGDPGPFDSRSQKDADTRSAARGPKLKEIPLRLFWPNLVTVLAICAGLTGMRMAIDGEFERAIYLVLLAAVLDGMDGRIARLLKATSKFGEQMDSLADIVNFGVVPAIVMQAYALDLSQPFGWIAALIFVIAGALRLARFNVMIDRPRDGPSWAGEYFVGVPAPAGALLVLMPVYLGLLGLEPSLPLAWAATVYTLVIAFLMVSRVPVWSGKAIGAKIRRDLVLPVLLLVALVAMVGYFFTSTALVVGCILFLATIPISARRYGRRLDEWVAAQAGER